MDVSIAGQTESAKARANGKWAVCLKPLQPGGPHTLTVSTGKRRLHFENVLVGEVWLCSGQSNMEFMMKEGVDGKVDIPQSGNAGIRLFDMNARWRTNAVKWDSSVLDSLNHLQYYANTEWVE